MKTRAIEAIAISALVAVFAAALSINACKGKQHPAVTLEGAGASFPFPIYSQWASDYEKLFGVKLNYQSIGSGGGIAQVKAGTVDFGASDAPLTREDLDASGLVQFPVVVGGVVPVVNVKGIASGDLVLTPKLLADIFLGKVARWDDPAIEALNPGLDLPAVDISVVHRSDGSGTTWIFTNYLDKVSPEWHEKVGTDKAVEWPAGVGGKGNEGVAGYVRQIDGSIGYVEYAYAVQGSIPHVRLVNRAGRTVGPDMASFRSAAASADWKGSPGFHVVLTDQPGEGSWPITGASFILLHRHQPDEARIDAMLSMFAWWYKYGDPAAERLSYVPMPDPVVDLVQESWKQIVTGGEPAWP